MNYLYHRVPRNLKGNYLMPLNELKRVYPEIYREHVKKYAGREELLKFKIPIWSCLWNDVLHMAAVPPKKLDKAFKEAEADLKWRRWFKISPKLLNLSNTIVYLYKKRPFKHFTDRCTNMGTSYSICTNVMYSGLRYL